VCVCVGYFFSETTKGLACNDGVDWGSKKDPPPSKTEINPVRLVALITINSLLQQYIIIYYTVALPNNKAFIPRGPRV